MSKEENINMQSIDDFKGELPVSFIKEDIPSLNVFHISAKTLRRNYIYQQRDEYISKYEIIPDEKIMEEFANNARAKYLQEGDYSFDKTTGEAVWLGTF